jgi:hypothetical protein
MSIVRYILQLLRVPHGKFIIFGLHALFFFNSFSVYCLGCSIYIHPPSKALSISIADVPYRTKRSMKKDLALRIQGCNGEKDSVDESKTRKAVLWS